MQTVKRTLLAVCLLGGLTACVAPAPSPLQSAIAFGSRFNQRDADSLMALFAEAPAWDFVYQTDNKAVVRNILEFWMAYNAHILVSSCRPASGSVTCDLVMVDDCLPPELEAYHFSVKFDMADGQIAAVTGTFDPDEAEAAREFWAKWGQWAPANLPEIHAQIAKPEVWAMIGADGQSAADLPASPLSAHEFGQYVAQVCQAYRATLK